MITLICPFYKNAGMLAEQVRMWNEYPADLRIMLVDDGSPEPALPIIEANASPLLWDRLQVYRVGVDIPWNRNGARNLGAKMAATDWIVQVDIDHILPPDCAEHLVTFHAEPKRWYRFQRFRRGAADETRKKDAIDPAVTYGPIKPHCDSYLCTRELYWRAGAYSEDFSGCLGGGSPFLAEMEKEAGKPALLPDDIFLEVYTRSVVADASDNTLSRDTSEYARRKAAMGGNYRSKSSIRFPWSRVA